VSDFVTELRREVVGAHAAHRHSAARSRRRRRRPLLGGAVALAVAVAAIVIAFRSLPATEQVTGPHVVTVLRIGGNPVDGVLAAGSLWVTYYDRREVVRIDPVGREMIARVPLGAPAEDIAAGDGSVWARGLAGDEATRIWRIDPATNRVVAHFDSPFGEGLALTPGSVWAPRRDHVGTGSSLLRLSATTGRRVGQIPAAVGVGLTASGRQLWTVTTYGAVVRIDGARGRVEHRWPGLTPGLAGVGDDVGPIVADRRGAWVIGTAQSTIYRLEGARIVRTIEIPADSQPLLAHTGGALWIASQEDRRGDFHLSRIDPDRGDVTAVVEVGRHRPQALVPVAGGLWVVGGDGTAVLIDT
jgi:hypothetical protein